MNAGHETQGARVNSPPRHGDNITHVRSGVLSEYVPSDVHVGHTALPTASAHQEGQLQGFQTEPSAGLDDGQQPHPWLMLLQLGAGAD